MEEAEIQFSFPSRATCPPGGSELLIENSDSIISTGIEENSFENTGATTLSENGVEQQPASSLGYDATRQNQNPECSGLSFLESQASRKRSNRRNDLQSTWIRRLVVPSDSSMKKRPGGIADSSSSEEGPRKLQHSLDGALEIAADSIPTKETRESVHREHKSSPIYENSQAKILSASDTELKQVACDDAPSFFTVDVAKKNCKDTDTPDTAPLTVYPVQLPVVESLRSFVVDDCRMKSSCLREILLPAMPPCTKSQPRTSYLSKKQTAGVDYLGENKNPILDSEKNLQHEEQCLYFSGAVARPSMLLPDNTDSNGTGYVMASANGGRQSQAQFVPSVPRFSACSSKIEIGSLIQGSEVNLVSDEQKLQVANDEPLHSKQTFRCCPCEESASTNQSRDSFNSHISIVDKEFQGDLIVSTSGNSSHYSNPLKALSSGALQALVNNVSGSSVLTGGSHVVSVNDATSSCVLSDSIGHGKCPGGTNNSVDKPVGEYTKDETHDVALAKDIHKMWLHHWFTSSEVMSCEYSVLCRYEREKINRYATKDFSYKYTSYAPLLRDCEDAEKWESAVQGDEDDGRCNETTVSFPDHVTESAQRHYHKNEHEFHVTRSFLPSASAMAIIGHTAKQLHAKKPEMKGLLCGWSALNDFSLRNKELDEK